MSVTETCMIESDPALVLSAGITDPEQVKQLCSDFFAREKEKEASYKKLPGLDLPYIYVAMMAGVPEVELEKGIPGTGPSEETEPLEEVVESKGTHKEPISHTSRTPHTPHTSYTTHTSHTQHNHGTHTQHPSNSPHNSSKKEQERKPKETGRRQHYSGGVNKKEGGHSYNNSPPHHYSHSSGHSSRSLLPNHSPMGASYPHQDPHMHRRHVAPNEMHPSSMTGHIPVMEHPHRSHGTYTPISQPPPIYHHGIPAPDLSSQQHMHSQYKEPSFQLSADLYQSPTAYPFKMNSVSNSTMDPHAPKFSMGSRHGHKRNNYYHMHHDPNSMIGSKATDFYPDVSHLANYNAGLPFNPNQKQTKFFILTSTVEENIFQSIRYGVWSSTSRGNKTLQTAINDGNSVILFYGAARMDYMYGCAEMKSSVDFEALTGLWHDDNWKGKFHVKWFYLKNVPKMHLANISEYSNPFRMCRDGMEVPWDVAKKALDIFRSFKARDSLLDKSIEFRPKLLHKTLRC